MAAKGTKTATRRAFGKVARMRSGLYQASYTGPDKERHYAGSTFETTQDADAWLIRERNSIRDETWISPKQRREALRADPGETFEDYAKVWLAKRRIKGQPIKARTREHYQYLLDGRILPTFGNLALKAITPELVETWHDRLQLDETPTATAHAYGLLHGIMASAAKKDRNGNSRIPWNPCQLGTQKATTVHQARPATVAELATILENMAPKYRLAIALMSWCALRFGETVALLRSDIDRKNRRVFVGKGVVRVGGERLVDTPKNRQGRRVAYPSTLDALIDDHLALYAEPGASGRLFTNTTGGYLSQSTLNGKPSRHRLIKGRMVNESATAFRKACEAAGRPDLRLHDLRHTGAVLAASTGATLAELMARLGHSTVAAAMRYQHTAQDRDQAIADALSKLVVGEA